MTWSYSRVSKFEKCPLDYKLHYLDKVRYDAPKAPALLRGSMVHKLAEDYLTGKITELPKELRKCSSLFNTLMKNQTTSEQKWHLHENWKMADNWSWLIVIADAVYFPKPKHAVVVDFKTGKAYPNHRDQLHLYAAATLHRFPHINRVRAKAAYLDKGEYANFEWSRKDLTHMTNCWRSRIRRVDNAKNFDPKPNFFCKWCDHHVSKYGKCPG